MRRLLITLALASLLLVTVLPAANATVDDVTTSSTRNAWTEFYDSGSDIYGEISVTEFRLTHPNGEDQQVSRATLWLFTPDGNCSIDVFDDFDFRWSQMAAHATLEAPCGTVTFDWETNGGPIDSNYHQNLTYYNRYFDQDFHTVNQNRYRLATVTVSIDGVEIPIEEQNATVGSSTYLLTKKPA